MFCADPLGERAASPAPKIARLWIAVGLGSVAGLSDVAEDLIVSAIFLDDVNHMLDRIRAGKQPGFHLADQSIVT